MLLLDLNLGLNRKSWQCFWFLLVSAGHDHFLSHPFLFIIQSHPAIQHSITCTVDKALWNGLSINNNSEYFLQSGPVHCRGLWWWILLYMGSSHHKHHACPSWWWFHSELLTASSIVLLAGHKWYRPSCQTVESQTWGNEKMCLSSHGCCWIDRAWKWVIYTIEKENRQERSSLFV